MNDQEFREYSLVLVGEREKIASDLACDCDLHVHSDDNFKHLEKGQSIYDQLLPELQEKIDLVNAYTKLPRHPWNQDNHPNCQWLGYHTLGLLTSERGVAKALQSCGYGKSVWKELSVYSDTFYGADPRCYIDCLQTGEMDALVQNAYVGKITPFCLCVRQCCLVVSTQGSLPPYDGERVDCDDWTQEESVCEDWKAQEFFDLVDFTCRKLHDDVTS